MSLYNMVNGMTPAVFFVLPMLGKHPNAYPRFRDCFISDEEHPQYDDHIHVYTRVGGGNRESYQDAIDELRAHPLYVTDFDDSFDSTFASFVFVVPDEWRADFERFKALKFSEFSHEYQQRLREMFPKLGEKFDELFATAG